MSHEISPAEVAAMARLHAQKMGLELKNMQQVIAKESLQEELDKGDFDSSIQQRFRSLEEKLKSQKIKAVEKKEGVDEEDANIVIEESHPSEDLAQEFEKNNPELKTKTLLILRDHISVKDSPEEILAKVQSFYQDYSLADEALQFLLETTTGALKENVEEAIERFRGTYQREITAGKNIFADSREFSEKGLGSPTALRDMYRDITGTVRPPLTLFDELFQNFSYQKMETVIQFLLSSLGSDLRSKGPSIEPAELAKLVADARTLQAILGVYRFFQQRMGLIHHQLEVYETTMPMGLDFTMLAKAYMQALKERYPSPLKFRDLGKSLGVKKDLASEIVIFSQMRDAVRQVAPKLYKDERHRKSVLSTWIELLEELEEEYEEEEDE